MAENRYDFVVFGASGFTGQFVVEELVRVVEEEGGSMTWAVAGRNMEKLQKVLDAASKKTGKDLENIPVIIADISSEESINEMCKKAKVVLNCVGPYRCFGEPIVKACIENGAHHLDISGEPTFLEKMQLLYSGKAREAGVYVVGACGFDSVPSDMGIEFTKKQFGGDLNSVEFFIRIIAGPEGVGGNVGTLESAVYGFAHSNELKPLRKSLFPNPLPRSQFKLQPKAAGFNEKIGKWCVNFPGSDRAVANRSIRYHYDVDKQRPFQVAASAEMPSFWKMLMIIFFGLIFTILTKFSFGRSLILKYPSLFSGGVFRKGGPTKTQIETCAFSITLVGEGWSEKNDDPDFQYTTPPNKRIVTQVSGPEAGYVATPIAMVQCAVVLLKEKDKLPPSGGVFTTSSAYSNTTLIQRLNDHNIIFRELRREDIA